MDALEDFSGSSDHLIIIKRKRNKRPRLPVSRTVISSSSSLSGGLISDDESADSDENMANCLIHLAQSGGGNCLKSGIGSGHHEREMVSSSSSSYSISTTKNKAGFFVYECKTCNRNFPSFQALGGHRASHKKPRILIEDQKEIFQSDEIEEEQVRGKFKRLSDDITSHPEFTIKLGHKESVGNQKGVKIHECLICGSEFSSGQALGGHMRRHRRNVVKSVETRDKSSASPPLPPAATTRVFQLDLNLPAPEEDHHHRDLKFQFASHGPALVDCHY